MTSAEPALQGNASLMGSSRIAPQSRNKKGRKRIAEKAVPYLMIAPAMIIVGVFMIYPIVYMIYLGFFDWDMLSDKVFVGLDNYITMFTDKEFWQVVGNTFTFMIMMVPPCLIISLLLAVYLKKNTFINKLIQNAIFLPNIVSLVSISFIWMWMMDSDMGLFNYLLGLLGIDPVNWLGDKRTAMLSLVIVNVWKNLGYYTLIFIAALQSIPKYLYESAELDRANRHRVFLKITLPMISPTIFFMALMGIISSFKTFEAISLMTSGGPANSTNTIVYYLYQQGFTYYKIGYASAVGVVLMLTSVLALVIIDRVGRKQLVYWGVSGMIVSLLCIGFYFMCGAALGLPSVFLLVFFLAYIFCCAVSICAVVWVLLSEMYPTRVRGLAMSIAGLALWVGTYLIGQLTPWMLENLTPAGTFFLFAAMCVPYMLIIWRAVPETTGRSLEEIEKYWQKNE